MVLDGLRFALQAIDPEELFAKQAIPIDSALQPLVETIRPFILQLSVILGGIFGVYLILILVRIYYERKNLKVLQAIRYDFDHLNEHYHIPNSRERLGWFQRVWQRLFRREAPSEKKAAKK